MAQVSFYKMQNSALSSFPIKEGQIIYVTDSKRLYLDNATNSRIEMTSYNLTQDSNNNHILIFTKPDGTTVSYTMPDTTYNGGDHIIIDENNNIDLDEQTTDRIYGAATKEGSGETVSLVDTRVAPLNMELKGNTSQVSYNQLVKNGNFTNLNDWTIRQSNGSVSNNEITLTGTSVSNSSQFRQSISFIEGHKYYFSCQAKTNDTTNTFGVKASIGWETGSSDAQTIITTTNLTTSYARYSNIITLNNNNIYVYLLLMGSAVENTTRTIKDVMLFDLTSMYGSGNEPTKEEFETQFTNEYYDYSYGLSPNPSYPQDIHVVSGDNEIKVVGRNLYNKNSAILGSLNRDTGRVNSVQTSYGTSDYIEINPTKLYYTNVVTFASDTLGYAFYDDNKVYISGVATRNNINNIPNNAKYIRICYKVSASSGNTDVNTLIFVEGNDTTYTPYQGNTYPIYLGVENLFDKNNANIVNGWINSTTMRLSTSQNDRILYIPCKSNTTYTISRSIITSSFRVATYDNTPFPTMTSSNVDYPISNYIAYNTSSSITITTGANAKYLVVHYGNVSNDSNLQESLNTIQIEEGTKANSYTPYGTTPIELCKIGDYQDYFYKNIPTATDYSSDRELGAWYLKKNIGKAVLDGSEGWGYSNDVFYLNRSDVKYLSGNYTYSSYFIGNENQNKTIDVYNNNANNSICCGSANNIRFYIKTDIASTVETFKTWLSTHNTIVYYPLATPTNEKFNDTIQEQLEDIYYNMLSYEGQTNVFQDNNDLPFNIEATAIKDLNSL